MASDVLSAPQEPLHPQQSAQCPLAALERVALGHHRQGDIDGALIPDVWFDFLRTGRVAMLSRVLEHNARDVHSMVELLQLLADAWKGKRAVSDAIEGSSDSRPARRNPSSRTDRLSFLGRNHELMISCERETRETSLALEPDAPSRCHFEETRASARDRGIGRARATHRG